MRAMSNPEKPEPISVDTFFAVDIRIGTVIAVDAFPEARKPAWKLTIDFGPEVGVKRSSAQIVDLYTAEALVGRQVMGVVNLPPRRIGPFVSEVLTLGFSDDQGRIVLAMPDRHVPNGNRMH
jgi:tRNA-binding protein